MGIVAIIPVAQMKAANDVLALAGFGPGNFSVPCYGGALATGGAAPTGGAAGVAVNTAPNAGTNGRGNGGSGAAGTGAGGTGVFIIGYWTAAA